MIFGRGNNTKFLVLATLINSSSPSYSTAVLSLLCSLPSRLSVPQIREAHALIVTSGLVNNGAIMGQLLCLLALSPSTSLQYPLSIYNSIHFPSVFASNSMIRCYAKTDQPRQSMVLYSLMRDSPLQTNGYTYAFVLHACSKASAVTEGTEIHSHIINLGFGDDLCVRNSLIQLYSTCSDVDSSKRVFAESPHCRDRVSWNTMLLAYTRAGQVLHAQHLFDEMPERDIISWTAMIAGYVQNGLPYEGLQCFKVMRKKGLIPNEAILVTVLSAAALLGSFEIGHSVHSIADHLKFKLTSSLGTALVDMYSKCGCIDQARVVFNSMPQRDAWTWNVMINGLASHGLSNEALLLFEEFRKNGFVPAKVTFVGVLYACSRAGLVQEGRRYFKLMTDRYGLSPDMEHFGCMVDLFARVGLVTEAMELIKSLRVPVDPVLWTTLLGPCKDHGFIEMGEHIGNELLQSNPQYDANYVQLASIYAQTRKWEDVIRVRRLMKDRRPNRVVGWSLIEAHEKI